MEPNIMPVLSKVMATALNNQMTKEFTASHLYRSMASFCYAEDFIGAGDFFYKHAAEEQSLKYQVSGRSVAARAAQK